MCGGLCQPLDFPAQGIFSLAHGGHLLCVLKMWYILVNMFYVTALALLLIQYLYVCMHMNEPVTWSSALFVLSAALFNVYIRGTQSSSRSRGDAGNVLRSGSRVMHVRARDNVSRSGSRVVHVRARDTRGTLRHGYAISALITECGTLRHGYAISALITECRKLRLSWIYWKFLPLNIHLNFQIFFQRNSGI